MFEDPKKSGWDPDAQPAELFVESLWEGFRDLPIGVMALDQSGRISFINSMAGFFLGLQPSAASGKTVQDIFPHPEVIDHLAAGTPYYHKPILVNGRQLRCSLVPVKNRDRLIWFIQVMIDYSSTISMETELAVLREKYQFLEMILEQTFEELAVVDHSGRLTYLTGRAARNWGVDRNEVLGRDVAWLEPGALLKKVAESGVPQVAHISRPHKKDLPVMVVPLYKDHELVGAIAKNIYTDLGQAKNSVHRLRSKNDGRCKPSSSPERRSGCKFTINEIVGVSKAIVRAKKKALRVAEGDSTVLITGETGTGKELFAQAIHMASLRRNGPFIRVNCAGIPENLLESELFGYEPGSFTGAQKSGKPGKFELAHNGTIFLDEASEMSMAMQAKLLSVIQESEFERVGGTVRYEVDVRILVATNKDLWELVNRGQFREDLYYRLDVVNIHIPPLRERIEDIPLLINHFIPCINSRINNRVQGVSQKVLDLFMKYDWPGNVRELKNVLEGAMNLNDGELIEVEALPCRVKNRDKKITRISAVETKPQQEVFKDETGHEKNLIEHALKLTQGNKRQAALYLKMPRSTFYNKLKRYNINAEPPARSQESWSF